MLGLWKDSAGDIYGFYKDNSFFGQWKDEEQDVLGVYALRLFYKKPIRSWYF